MAQRTRNRFEPGSVVIVHEESDVWLIDHVSRRLTCRATVRQNTLMIVAGNDNGCTMLYVPSDLRTRHIWLRSDIFSSLEMSVIA